jgi:hypothetical protein
MTRQYRDRARYTETRVRWVHKRQLYKDDDTAIIFFPADVHLCVQRTEENDCVHWLIYALSNFLS